MLDEKWINFSDQQPPPNAHIKIKTECAYEWCHTDASGKMLESYRYEGCAMMNQDRVAWMAVDEQ